MNFSRAGRLTIVVLVSTSWAASAQKSILLFGTDDLSRWSFITPDKTPIETVCHSRSDGVIAVDGKPLGYLQTTASYEKYRLHVEWRWTAHVGNSGILVDIASGAMDRNLWPLCFQIQTKHERAGDMLPMAGAKFAEELSTPPGAKTPQLDRTAANNEKPVGEWNSCDITCRHGTIEVMINGTLQNRVTHCMPSSGRVGFQLEGSPYELRNVRIEVLD